MRKINRTQTSVAHNVRCLFWWHANYCGFYHCFEATHDSIIDDYERHYGIKLTDQTKRTVARRYRENANLLARWIKDERIDRIQQCIAAFSNK